MIATDRARDKAGESLEKQNEYAEYKIRAEWSGGRLLRGLERGEPGRPEKGGNDAAISPYKEAVNAAGLSGRDARRWQKLGVFALAFWLSVGGRTTEGAHGSFRGASGGLALRNGLGSRPIFRDVANGGIWRAAVARRVGYRPTGPSIGPLRRGTIPHGASRTSRTSSAPGSAAPGSG